MESEELDVIKQDGTGPRVVISTHVVTADSVQAEEVPTIPLGSLQTISELHPEISVHSIASTSSVSMPTPLVAQPSEYRRGFGEWLKVWWDGVRPAYLPLSLMPILVGSVLAWTQTISTRSPLGHFHLTHFIGAIIAVMLLQFGANLINDYYDYLRGIDTGNILGPGGLIQQGLIKPTRVLTYGFVLLGSGSFCGLIVASGGGWSVFLLGLIGVLCAYFYSATSHSLSSLALGEAIAFCVFGPLITIGAYLVQNGGNFNSSALIYSLPLGLLAAATIHVNNMRDIEGDSHAGKRTLASIIGMNWSRVWFLVLLLAAYVVVILNGVPHRAPHWILLVLWTLPSLVVITTGVLRTDSLEGFHLVIRQMLQLITLFALLLAVGLILTAIIPVLPHIPAHILPF